MSATAATSALALLRAHLDQRASHGTKLVALSKDARLALRSLIQFPPSRRATHPATPLATSNPEVRTVADASATPAAVFAQAFAPAARSAPPASPVAAELAPPAPLESLVLEVPGTTLEAQLAALAAMADPQMASYEKFLVLTLGFSLGAAFVDRSKK